MEFDIQHGNNGVKGYFFIETQGKILAHLDYSVSDGNMIIVEYTEVSRPHRGKGIGHQLVSTAIDYARKSQMKILPVCTFTRSIFLEKGPDLEDVLARS